MNTVAQGRLHVADVVKGGSSPDSPAVLAALNRAQQALLMDDALVDLTMRMMRFSARSNMIACPACVERVVAYKTNNTPGVLPKSQFYEFIPGGSWSSDWVSGCKTDMVDLGDHQPTMFEIDSEYAPQAIHAICSDAADVGVEIALDGYDENGWRPLTGGEYGTVVECVAGLSGTGITVDAADLLPTAFEFTQLTKVIKPVTRGYVALMTYDEDDDYWWTLAIYQPKDTIPSFHRYKLTLPRDEDGTCVRALVKLRHVPLLNDSDIIVIQNLEAIRFQIMAQEYETANPVMSDKYQAMAIGVMRRDVAKKTPDTDITVNTTYGLGTLNPV